MFLIIQMNNQMNNQKINYTFVKWNKQKFLLSKEKL